MILALVKAMRPHQWVKNVFVLAPLVFAQKLFDEPAAIRVAIAFALFCLASSTVYLLNDLADLESDRAHPVKRNRPIASGALPVNVARAALGIFGLVAIGVGFYLETYFGVCVLSYLVLNVSYSLKLKHIAYVDVLCIASGFELRVLGGAFAALVDPSMYLLVVTFALATFLGFGKRMHELKQQGDVQKQRKVLSSYNRKVLDGLLYVSGLVTVVTYAVYTLDPHTREMFGSNYLAVTSIMPLFGVLRFLHLVRQQDSADSPTDVMLKDWPFVVNVLIWAGLVVGLVYFSA